MERSINYFFTFILFSATLTVVMAAVGMEIQKSTNGKCKYQGRFYNIGDDWQGDGCSGIHCYEGPKSDEVTLEYSSCGAVSYPPNCKVEYDRRLKYPECCQPKVTCLPTN